MKITRRNTGKLLNSVGAALIGTLIITSPNPSFAGCKSWDVVCQGKEKAKQLSQEAEQRRQEAAAAAQRQLQIARETELARQAEAKIKQADEEARARAAALVEALAREQAAAAAESERLQKIAGEKTREEAAELDRLMKESAAAANSTTISPEAKKEAANVFSEAKKLQKEVQKKLAEEKKKLVNLTGNNKKQAEKETKQAADRYYKELKRGLSFNSCVEVVKGLRSGADKQEEALRIALKKFRKDLQGTVTGKSEQFKEKNALKTDKKEKATNTQIESFKSALDFFVAANQPWFKLAQKATNTVKNLSDWTINELFTPEAMCGEKSGKWFVKKLKEKGVDLVSSVRADAEKRGTTGSQFVSLSVTGNYGADGLDLAVTGELVLNVKTGESKIFIALSPSVGIQMGGNISVGVNFYGIPPLASMKWDDFPGYGAAMSLGAKMPGVPALDLTYAISSPLGKLAGGKGWGGFGVSYGFNDKAIGVFNVGPNYTHKPSKNCRLKNALVTSLVPGVGIAQAVSKKAKRQTKEVICYKPE